MPGNDHPVLQNILLLVTGMVIGGIIVILLSGLMGASPALSCNPSPGDPVNPATGSLKERISGEETSPVEPVTDVDTSVSPLGGLPRDLVLEKSSIEDDRPSGRYITGILRNNGNQSYETVDVIFRLYDKDGKPLGTSEAVINNVSPGVSADLFAWVTFENTASYRLIGIKTF